MIQEGREGVPKANKDNPQHLKVIEWRFGLWMVQLDKGDVEKNFQCQAPGHPYFSNSPAVLASWFKQVVP